MNFLAKRQQGLTFISIFIILVILGSIALLIMKIVPIYMDHSKVVNALTAVENMVDVETMSKREIIISLDKRFGMNYVEHIKKEDITITKAGGFIRVEIEYERVEKIIGNLSVLVEFYDFFEAGIEG